MAVKQKVKFHPNVVDYFKNFPFYNKQFKKSRVKRLKTLIWFLSFLFMKN